MATNIESMPMINKRVTTRPSPPNRASRSDRFVSLVRSGTKDRLQMFDSLQSLEPDTRQEVRKRFRSHLIRLIAAEHRLYFRLEPIGWGILTILPLLLLLTPILVNLPLRAHYSIRTWIGMYTLYWILLIVIAALAFWPAVRSVKLFSRDLKERLISLSQAYSFVILITGLYMFLFVRFVQLARAGVTDPLYHVVMASLVAYFLLFAAVILLPAITWLAFYINDRRTNARHPDSVIIVRLFKILLLLERHPGRWAELEFKHELTHKLERIALRIEYNLPRRLHSDDNNTDLWLAKTTYCMAAAFRDKKKLVLTSGLDTRVRFQESMKNYFINALMDNWAGFERLDGGDLPRKPVRYQLIDYLQTIVRGAMPLVIVWVFQKSPIGIKDPTADYAMMAALLWLVLTLLFKIDPLSMDKLDAIARVKELIKK